jgi:hypothetical protein
MPGPTQGNNPTGVTEGELWRNLIMDLGYTGGGSTATTGLGGLGSIDISEMGTIIAQLDQALFQFRAAGAGYAGITAPTGTLSATALRQELTVAAMAFPGTGVLQLVQTHVPINTKISNFNFLAGTTGDAGPTHQWMALYDNARNLLAISADATSTAITASVVATYPVANINNNPGAPASGSAAAATSFTTYYTGRYYIGLMIATGNAPTFTASAAVVAANTVVPINSGASTGSLTTPTAIPAVAGAITASADVPYFYLT